MKGYLYIKEKSGKSHNSEVTKLIDSVKECKHQYTIDNVDDISVYFFNNEDKNFEFSSENYTVAYSGLLTTSFKELSDNLNGKTIEENIDYISNMSGISSVSFLDKTTKSIYAFNGFSGVNPVFYCETDSRIVIGTDPLVVNCIAYSSDKPQFDLSNIASFLMMGFFFSHDTLFKNVKSIPFNHYIELKGNYFDIKPIDDSLDTVFTLPATDENYDNLAKSFIEAFDVVSEDKTPTLGLTGGKDSRLLVVGMQENQIEFNAVTRGHNDHPDVIIAKKLAESLNLKHKVNPNIPKGKENLTVDLTSKILRTMKGTSGQLFGYENISYQTTFKGNLGLNGVGAESIRGGFAVTRSIDNDVDKHETLIKNYFPFKNLIKEEYTKKYSNELYEFSKSPRSIKQLGNLLFLEFYNGNRTASARQALLYYSTPVSPFFDNKFLKRALQFDIEELSTEKLQYNLMKTLNSKSVEIPLANSRWLFEKEGPVESSSFKNWFNTEPVTPKSQRGGYNWRLFKNKDKDLINAFKTLLLDNPDSKVYEIVNFDLVNDIFNKESLQKYSRFLWALLSIKIYTEYYETGQIVSKELNLKLPSSKEIEKYEPELFDLTNDIQPLNKKIIFDHDNGLISIDQMSELNGYIILGDNNLTSPVSNMYFEKFKVREKSKDITFQMCVDNLSNDYAISTFVIQFDSYGKRVNSKRFDLKSKGLGEQVYGHKFRPNDKAHSVKFAFVIKSELSEPLIEVKYAYIRHN